MSTNEMKNRKIACLSPVFFGLFFSFVNWGPYAFPVVNESIIQGQGINDEIRISISSKEGHLQAGTPFVVRMRIVNNSSEPLSLKSFPEARLSRNQEEEPKAQSRDELYSIIQFESDSIYLKTDTLDPRKKIEVEFDLSKQKWAKVKSSFIPSHSLFELVNSGRYKLHVDLIKEEQMPGKTLEKRLSSNYLVINVMN